MKEGRRHNRRLAKKRVQCLNEALCFVSSSVLSENLLLRNPLLRQAPKRCIQCIFRTYADVFLVFRFSKLTANVLALGEEADFEALNCLPAQNLIRSTKLHLSTEPAFLPNACYRQILFLAPFVPIVFTYFSELVYCQFVFILVIYVDFPATNCQVTTAIVKACVVLIASYYNNVFFNVG